MNLSSKITRFTACLATLLTLLSAKADSPWSVRYATFSSLTEEQLQEGMLPTWQLGLPDSLQSAILISDHESGGAIGYILLGLPLELTSDAPGNLQVSLEYQSWSSHPARTATLDAFVMTASAWDRFAVAPLQPKRMPELSMREAVGFGGPASSFRGEDVKEWKTWKNRDLQSRLRLLEAEPLFLVLRLGGYHAAHREQILIRNVEVHQNEKWEPELRKPRFPLKSARTLRTDQEIQQARRNIEEYPAAAKVRDKILEAAQPWLDRSDANILRLIPPATVPRAFSATTEGCPVHGKGIYEHGVYPWILDTDRPYYVECPIGHETYPSNDFQAFIDSGFTDRDSLTGDYADDGWGWVAPDGHRYWFVAYATHWHWRKLIPATSSLAQAYTLTGEERYAHKAALILSAIAERYPAMDYATQSRYGLLRAGEGGEYPGKILNHIWETAALGTLAEAYDAIWETIDANRSLQERLDQTSEEIRASIEANILEEGIECIFDGRIRGNFGMHQNALSSAAITRQHGPVDEWLESILTKTGVPLALEGLEYALYNLIYRDGMSFETSPGYSRIWPTRLYEMAERLKPRGIDLFRLPRFESLSSIFLDIQVLGKFTPDTGDSGDLSGGIVMPDPSIYQTAAREYEDPRFQAWLREAGVTGDRSFRHYNTLFEEPPADPGDGIPAAARGSRLLDGYGMAILETAAADVGLSLYYGYRGGHGHRDTLNIDLYAGGQKMLPDLGYPDFMNAYVPGIYSWSKNTISHNLVMIDRKQQPLRGPGQVTRYFSKAGVHAVEVDASDTVYEGIDRYRRGVLLIEKPEDGAYLLDLFQVRGGSEHHYSLHGPPGQIEFKRGSWSAPAEGTLAGPEVEIGAIHDHPEMSRPGYSGSYASYTGSGFSHFFNVQRLENGPALLRFAHERDPDARLELRPLPEGEEEILAADAFASPTRQKEKLKYLITRRETNESLFLALAEPYATNPSIRQALRTKIAGGVAVEVDAGDWRDVILYRTSEGGELRHGGCATDGEIAVFRFALPDEKLAGMVFAGGSNARSGSETLRHTNLNGRVVSLSPAARTAVVQLDTSIDPEVLVGAYPAFRHGKRIVRHRVIAARALPKRPATVELHFADDLLIGRGRIGEVKGRSVTTPTNISIFPDIYRESRITDENFEQFIPVSKVSAGLVDTSEPIPPGFLTVGENERGDFWLCSFGPGARFALETVSSQNGISLDGRSE